MTSYDDITQWMTVLHKLIFGIALHQRQLGPNWVFFFFNSMRVLQSALVLAAKVWHVRVQLEVSKVDTRQYRHRTATLLLHRFGYHYRYIVKTLFRFIIPGHGLDNMWYPVVHVPWDPRFIATQERYPRYYMVNKLFSAVALTLTLIAIVPFVHSIQHFNTTRQFSGDSGIRDASILELVGFCAAWVCANLLMLLACYCFHKYQRYLEDFKPFAQKQGIVYLTVTYSVGVVGLLGGGTVQYILEKTIVQRDEMTGYMIGFSVAWEGVLLLLLVLVVLVMCTTVINEHYSQKWQWRLHEQEEVELPEISDIHLNKDEEELAVITTSETEVAPTTRTTTATTATAETTLTAGGASATNSNGSISSNDEGSQKYNDSNNSNNSNQVTQGTTEQQ